MVTLVWRLAALGSGSREPSRRGSSKISRTVVSAHPRAASRDRCGGRGPSILHKAHKEVFQNAGNSMGVIVSVIGWRVIGWSS